MKAIIFSIMALALLLNINTESSAQDNQTVRLLNSIKYGNVESKGIYETIVKSIDSISIVKKELDRKGDAHKEFKQKMDDIREKLDQDLSGLNSATSNYNFSCNRTFTLPEEQAQYNNCQSQYYSLNARTSAFNYNKEKFNDMIDEYNSDILPKYNAAKKAYSNKLYEIADKVSRLSSFQSDLNAQYAGLKDDVIFKKLLQEGNVPQECQGLVSTAQIDGLWKSLENLGYERYSDDEEY